MKNGKQIKLEDLASRLNVSKVTISKALRNHPDISAETIRKVKQLADELGYIPNYMARNLSSRKSRTIGLVVPKIAHAFFSTMIEAVYDAAFEENYEILLMVSQENGEREKKHIQTLLAMRIDGLIISISEKTKDVSVFENLKNMNVPLVFVDRTPQMENLNTVIIDDRKSAYKGVEFAIKRGFKNIGHLAGFGNTNIGRERRLGFEDAMRDYNLPINHNWVVEGGFAERDGYFGFMKMTERGSLPDYIFASTFPVALGAKSAAKKLGINIPGDIELICFSSDVYDYQSPQFDIIFQPADLLGKEAVKLMLKKINPDNEEFDNPERIVLETTIVPRLPLG